MKPVLFSLGGINHKRAIELRDAGFELTHTNHPSVTGIVLGRNWRAALTNKVAEELSGLPVKNIDGWIYNVPADGTFKNLKAVKARLMDEEIG